MDSLEKIQSDPRVNFVLFTFLLLLTISSIVFVGQSNIGLRIGIAMLVSLVACLVQGYWFVDNLVAEIKSVGEEKKNNEV